MSTAETTLDFTVYSPGIKRDWQETSFQTFLSRELINAWEEQQIPSFSQEYSFDSIQFET